MVFVRQNELIFHHQIADKVERYNIPDSLILNFDQITDKALSQYKDSNIEVVFVSANMTGLLQPLDLTVNGYAKKYYKSKFNH